MHKYNEKSKTKCLVSNNDFSIYRTRARTIFFSPYLGIPAFFMLVLNESFDVPGIGYRNDDKFRRLLLGYS